MVTIKGGRDVLPGMNAGASTYAVPSPIEGSGTAWVLLGSWALSPARPTPIHPRHECRGLSALFGDGRSRAYPCGTSCEQPQRQHCILHEVRTDAGSAPSYGSRDRIRC